ncbi:MAG: hypothetical protein ACOVOV_13560 [Dolichospermum sp.]
MANTSPLSTPLTQESIQNALNYLSQKFPHHAANIAQFQNEIVQNMLNNTTPSVGSPVLAVQKTSVNLNLAVSSNTPVADNNILTPCESAIGACALDVVFLVLSIAGLGASSNLISKNAFAAMLGKDTLNGFQFMIEEIKSTSGLAQALHVFDLFGQIYKAGGVDAIIQDWENSDISWWDWVTTGVEVIAQIVAWIATDGVALAAQVVIVLVDATELIADIVNCVNTCNIPNLPTTPTFTPLGTYINSSNNVRVTLNSKLPQANAAPSVGQMVTTSTYDITNLNITTGFDNINGVLQVSQNAGTSPNTFIPNGSYLQSAVSNNVTLSANCLTIQGATVQSTLDITNLQLSQTISNINGVLTIDSN